MSLWPSLVTRERAFKEFLMKIVSSFKVDSWEVYSSKFLETFAEFWPK